MKREKKINNLIITQYDKDSVFIQDPTSNLVVIRSEDLGDVAEFLMGLFQEQEDKKV